MKKVVAFARCLVYGIIDLFRLYILFSQYRSCDDTQEIWSFVLFIKASMNMSTCTLFNEQDKGSNLLSIITWSVLGKQNVQAKKVYWNDFSVVDRHSIVTSGKIGSLPLSKYSKDVNCGCSTAKLCQRTVLGNRSLVWLSAMVLGREIVLHRLA